jgi:hypothetical protein
MLQRMLYGYAGAILPLLLYVIFPVVESVLPLPIRRIVATSGTPMLCVILYVSTEGFLLGFIIADWQRQLTTRAIIIRTAIASAAWAVCTIPLISVPIDLRPVTFPSSSGHIFIPLVGPLVAALASEFVLRGSTRDQSRVFHSGANPARSIAMPGERILFGGYAGGAVLVASLIASIPLAAMLGLNLLSHVARTFIFNAQIGSLLGFVISDRQRQFAPKAILMRTIVALVVLMLWTALWFALKDYYHSKQGWASPIGGFLLAALASEFVFRESTPDEPAEKQLGLKA